MIKSTNSNFTQVDFNEEQRKLLESLEELLKEVSPDDKMTESFYNSLLSLFQEFKDSEYRFSDEFLYFLGALYIIIRDYSIPIYLNELGHLSGIQSKSVRKAAYNIIKTLRLKVLPDYKRFLNRDCHLFNIENEDKNKIEQLLYVARTSAKSVGASPKRVLAGAIYYLYDQKRRESNSRRKDIPTQAKIAEKMNVSINSIRKYFKIIKKQLTKNLENGERDDPNGFTK